jgi:hypothetical protein
MVNWALPWVDERSTVEKPNISAKGTWAFDGAHGPFVLGADDDAAALVQQPHDGALEFGGGFHHHLHDGLEDHRFGFGVAS